MKIPFLLLAALLITAGNVCLAEDQKQAPAPVAPSTENKAPAPAAPAAPSTDKKVGSGETKNPSADQPSEKKSDDAAKDAPKK